MSISAVMYPIVAAVKGVEQILGPNLAWHSTNPLQQQFLAEQFNECRNEVEQLAFIETLASLKHEELNAFLAKRGFSIKLEPFVNPTDFGVVSVLDIGVEWTNEGRKMPIQLAGKGKQYPGVSMAPAGFTVRQCPSGHPNLIASLSTKSGDVVNLTVASGIPWDAPTNGMVLANLVQKYENESVQVYNDYDSLRFPMVDMSHESDISWLKEMWTKAKGASWRISQALQQTKLRINHQGARAQSAVAIGGMMITSVQRPKPVLVIDQPFLCWFTRPGVQKPTFVAYVTPEDWKEPADLTTA